MTTAEIWKPVVGAEGFYDVSSLGRVRSVDREVQCRNGVARRYKGKLRAPHSHQWGYPSYTLNLLGERKTMCAHTLVALAFLGPRPKGMQIRHKDGDCMNPTVENLAYGTPVENNQDTIRHGRNQFYSRLHCKYGHMLAGLNSKTLVQGEKCYRVCVACNRAGAALQRRGKTRRDPEYKTVADRYYEELMAS